MPKAVRFDQYGDVDVLYLAEVERPVPGPEQVLVNVKAAGINPGEIAIREGLLEEMYPTTFPCGEGSDVSGVVEEVGSGVTNVSVGDEIYGWSDTRSTHAEYTVIPARQALLKAANVSWEVAGSLFVAGSTAYACVEAVDAQSGETVVVSAAAGGVGSIVVQLLRDRGVNVIGLASERNHDWLRSVGVEPVTYGEGMLERVKAAAPNSVDAVIDTFGPDYVKLGIDLGVDPQRINTIIAYQASHEYGTKMEGSAAGSRPEVLAEIGNLVAEGKVEIPIAATFPLDRVKDAFIELAKRQTRGKIVLIP